VRGKYVAAGWARTRYAFRIITWAVIILSHGFHSVFRPEFSPAFQADPAVTS
jgi:hypothetical protein